LTYRGQQDKLLDDKEFTFTDIACEESLIIIAYLRFSGMIK